MAYRLEVNQKQEGRSAIDGGSLFCENVTDGLRFWGHMVCRFGAPVKRYEKGEAGAIVPLCSVNKLRHIHKTIGVILLSVAFALRLAYSVFVVGINAPPFQHIGADDGDYDKLAWHMTIGEGYAIVSGQPTAYRAPGYPIFLAAIYKIFGHNYAAVRVLQALVGALSCVLLFLIVERLTTLITAVLSAFIYAIYPFALHWAGYVMSETLFILGLLFLVWLLLNRKERHRFVYFLGCGVLTGFLALIKSQAVLLYIFILPWLFFDMDKRMKHFAKACIAMSFGMFLVIAPWTLRNYRVFNRIVPLTTLGGETFLACNNPLVLKNFNDEYVISVMSLPGIREKVLGMDEVERDKLYKKETVKFLSENPAAIPLLVVLKVWQLFNPIPHPKVRNRWIVICSYGVLFPFMISGMIMLFRDFRRLSLIYLLILFQTTVAAIMTGFSRQRMPIEPFLIMFAAYAIVTAITYMLKWPCFKGYDASWLK